MYAQINEIVKESCMSKKEIAGKIGKQPSWLVKILGGGQNITLRSLKQIADALDHTVHICFIPNNLAKTEKVITSNKHNEKYVVSF